MTEPKILERKVLAESKLFTIEGVHLEFANGQQRHFERIAGHVRGSVMVVPMLDDGTLLLIREYGVGLEQYVIAFPKGAIDANEAAVDTAKRELVEEVGYGTKCIEPLVEFASSAAYISSTMQVFVAKELYPESGEGDEPEPLVVVPWKISEVDQLLAHPEFIEARSIAALLLFVRRYIDTRT